MRIPYLRMRINNNFPVMRVIRNDKDQFAAGFPCGYGSGCGNCKIEGIRAMKATIWHNPACGTSRKTLAILEEKPGVDVTVIEYLKHAPAAEKLAQLYRDAGISPQQGLRLRGTDAEERGLPDANAATVLAAMVAEPKLIERPLVETDKGVRLCRPQDLVHEIL
jgi:arsenate reductase (glutaredoxin)